MLNMMKNELNEQYNWLIDYCKDNDLDPTVNSDWKLALDAWSNIDE